MTQECITLTLVPTVNVREGDTDVDTLPFPDTQQSAGRSQQCAFSPPPPEKWEVWHNRFDDVANRRGWSEELLPRLQGSNGYFVFSQLSARIRSSY